MVYRRRTGLSKVTFLKVGWVKISQFLPRTLTQAEAEKQNPLASVPLEVWAGFGIGILVLAPKFPSVVSIPATHNYSEFFAFHNFFALHMGHRTPQVGTYTYCKIHALCKIFALHKIVVLRVFFLFFLAKIAWNHVFWNMGKMEFSRETSVVSHTIAFQAILAKKQKKKKKEKENQLSRVNCDNFLVYLMEKKLGWDPKRRSKGAEGGHAYCFIFAFQKISALQGCIVLYRWNYFARKKTGSSMICVPRSCCAELFAGPQRCQERWGWRGWWQASQACQNISWKLMNWVLRPWKV